MRPSSRCYLLFAHHLFQLCNDPFGHLALTASSNTQGEVSIPSVARPDDFLAIFAVKGHGCGGCLSKAQIVAGQHGTELPILLAVSARHRIGIGLVNDDCDLPQHLFKDLERLAISGVIPPKYL